MKVKDKYSLQEIRNEVRHLVDLHSLDRQQALYSLSQFFSAGEWNLVECELETRGYCLMTNTVEDLLEG